MLIHVKKLRPSAVIPTRGSEFAAGYDLYACLDEPLVIPAALVPAAAFWVGSALRARINRPRPYTALGYQPLFPKNEAGRSMPSRHCFSAAAIAVVALHCSLPMGVVLAVLAVLIAVSRVITGVHYISDVLAGLAFGSGFALVGWQVYLLAARALLG